MPRRAAPLAASLVRAIRFVWLSALVSAASLIIVPASPLAAQGGFTPMALSNGITVTTRPTVLPAKLPNTGPFYQVFTVYNDKNYSIAVEFSCNGVGPVSCGDVFPGGGQVPAHDHVSVTVEYSTTSGTGEAEVRASAVVTSSWWKG